MSRQETQDEYEFDTVLKALGDKVSRTEAPLFLLGVLDECARERIRQYNKFGDQAHRHLGGLFAILSEEYGEVAREICEMTFAKPGPTRVEIGQRLRKELIEMVACGLHFLEAGDRKGWANWPFETHLVHVGEDGK